MSTSYPNTHAVGEHAENLYENIADLVARLKAKQPTSNPRAITAIEGGL
jgi:hypothetical protein